MLFFLFKNVIFEILKNKSVYKIFYLEMIYDFEVLV